MYVLHIQAKKNRERYGQLSKIYHSSKFGEKRKRQASVAQRAYRVNISLSSGQNVLHAIYFIRWISTYPLHKVIRSSFEQLGAVDRDYLV